MGRFVVLDGSAASLSCNAGEYPWCGMRDDYANYLIDTESGAIVFCDEMEPEDAELRRALRPLVDLLNEIDAERQHAVDTLSEERVAE
jgi:hypothetical protein